jgi:hypothetical protein
MYDFKAEEEPKIQLNQNFSLSARMRKKGLADVIQGLLTIVAQLMRRFGWAAGSGVGGRSVSWQSATKAAVAERRSMAGI